MKVRLDIALIPALTDGEFPLGIKLALSFNRNLLPCKLRTVHGEEVFFISPEMSNSGSPPAKPGVYLNEINGFQVYIETLGYPNP